MTRRWLSQGSRPSIQAAPCSLARTFWMLGRDPWLNIAMAYGGRQEIAQAFRRYLRDAKAEGRSLDEVLETFQDESIEPFLYTSGQPEPDLILRTSGEVRLGGFLLWQSANSEFYFCDANWPALRKIDLLRALRSYHQRQRRNGR